MRDLLNVAHTLFRMGAFFSLLLLTPAIVSIVYGDGLAWLHIAIAVASVTLCVFFARLTRKYHKELKNRDGFTLVVLAWVLFTLLAATPMWLVIPGSSYLDACFEAISGLTTTGETCYSGLDKLPESINFWRHMLNWMGGMGIIVLAVAFLPLLGVGGMQLYKAEVSGIDKTGKLTPRIRNTAKTLWGTYTLITIVIIIMLKLAGMNWLDAICHAFAAISLGGYSTHDASVGYFNSLPIELVLCFGMLMGAFNFSNHYLALKNRSIKHYFKDEEARVMVRTLFGSIIVVSIFTWSQGTYGFTYDAYWQSLRYTLFNYFSIALNCGFANYDFATWPVASALWMYMLAMFLSNSGSTGGGIKTVRAIVLMKVLRRELKLQLDPNQVSTIKFNGAPVSRQVAINVMSLVFAFIFFIMLGTFALVESGMDLLSSFSIIVASITNSGPGLGDIGPATNAGLLNSFQKLVCMFMMLIGRLELFTVMIIFTKDYWRR